MHAARTLMLLSMVTTLWSAEAGAQASPAGRFEAAFLVGWTKTTTEHLKPILTIGPPPPTVLSFDVSSAYQATFAWRFWQGETINLSVEVPFIASPAIGVKTAGASFLPKEYASLYLTPGVRVTFHAERTVSFFGAVGGGYARYSESTLRLDNSPNPQQEDTNAGALQFGGGVDVRGPGWLGLRGEVRDLYTGRRNFSVTIPGDRVPNVIGSVGIVLRY